MLVLGEGRGVHYTAAGLATTLGLFCLIDFDLLILLDYPNYTAKVASLSDTPVLSTPVREVFSGRGERGKGRRGEERGREERW